MKNALPNRQAHGSDGSGNQAVSSGLGWRLGLKAAGQTTANSQQPVSSSQRHIHTAAGQASPSMPVNTIAAGSATRQPGPDTPATMPLGMGSSQLFVQPPCTLMAPQSPIRGPTMASPRSLQSQLTRLQQLRNSAQSMVCSTSLTAQQQRQQPGTASVSAVNLLTSQVHTAANTECQTPGFPSTPWQQVMDHADQPTPHTAALRALAVQPATPSPIRTAAVPSHGTQEVAAAQHQTLTQQLQRMRQLQFAGRALLASPL